jgi:aminopeptidase N
MLQFFASKVGEAPYPHFTLAAIDDNLPGGHSPAYFAAFHQPLPTTPYSWAQDPVAFEDVYPHLFLAHEIAHQWWGQAIGWKNYHEQWLSEGLAQYFSALYAAKDRGPEVLDRLIEEMRKSAEPYFAQGPIALGYRLGHIKRDGQVFRALVYNKSAVVLHMLRRLIGDEAFFSGLRRFYTTWRFQKAGTGELRAAFEAGTPIRLERFFEQWIQGFGRPALRLTWETPVSQRAIDAPDTSRVRIEQVGEVYDLPITLAIQYVDGRTEEVTLKVTDRVVEAILTGRIRRVTVRDALSLYEIVR